MFARKVVKVLPAHGFDYFAEHDKAHVAVGELRARLILQRQIKDAFPCLLRPVEKIAFGIVRNKTALVQQKLPDRDLFLALGGEVRQIFCNRVVVAQAAVLDEPGDARRRRARFRDRREVKYRVGGHGQWRRLELPLAVCLEENDLAVPPDFHDAARHVAGRQ